MLKAIPGTVHFVEKKRVLPNLDCLVEDERRLAVQRHGPSN
jgi:hypothetical protein